jgi:hypothetical protein
MRYIDKANFNLHLTGAYKGNVRIKKKCLFLSGGKELICLCVAFTLTPFVKLHAHRVTDSSRESTNISVVGSHFVAEFDLGSAVKWLGRATKQIWVNNLVA